MTRFAEAQVNASLVHIKDFLLFGFSQNLRPQALT